MKPLCATLCVGFAVAALAGATIWLLFRQPRQKQRGYVLVRSLVAQNHPTNGAVTGHGSIDDYQQAFGQTRIDRVRRVFDKLAKESSTDIRNHVAEMLAAQCDRTDYNILFENYAFGKDQELAAIAQSVMARLSSAETLMTLERRFAKSRDEDGQERLLQAIAISSADAAVPYLVERLDARLDRPLPLLAALRDALLNNGGKQAFQALFRNASYVPDSPEAPLISGMLERSEVAESQAVIFLQSAPFAALDAKGVRMAVDILAGATPSPERDRLLDTVAVLHPSAEVRAYAAIRAHPSTAALRPMARVP